MRLWWPLLLLPACVEPAPEGEGLIGRGVMDPFPTVLQVRDGRVDLPSDLPVPAKGSWIPEERVEWRTGFSPAQVSVVQLGVVDTATLPGWRAPTPGEGGVLLVDLDEGRFLPVMAELDAHPDAADDPTLIIRPLQTVPAGHTAAVVVTTAVADRPARFDALIEGRPPRNIEHLAEHFRGLVDDLAALGIDPEEIALCWDYPVAAGTEPVLSAVSQVAPSGAYYISRIREKDEGDRVAPHTWRAGSGSYEVTTFLREDGWLDLDLDDGSVSPTGTVLAPLYVHVPESVKDAPAGTVPVLVFGHGIFSTAEQYLDDMGDEDGVLALAEEAGVIVVATKWFGMSADERIDALGVADDFGQLPIVTDRLVDGVARVHALVDLVREGPLLDDPFFEGASGQKLADTTRVSYAGISLGGIEGAVLVGSGADVDAAVLHVGGGAWSTMLERSTQWVAFELFIDISVPDPGHRQLLYAGSQLFWDPVDPVTWIPELAAGPPVLWQESIGDEQVPNLTTELIARSVGATVLAPEVRLPGQMSLGVSPLAAPATALAQFDPEKGEPDDVNRPPGNLHAHDTPRAWPGAWRQAAHFVESGGEVVHFCGDDPCTAGNTGSASR